MNHETHCPICGNELMKYHDQYFSGEYGNILNDKQWYACDHCKVTFSLDEIDFPDGGFEQDEQFTW